MNILLINVHSFRNAGDHVLAAACIEQLHRLFPGCRITVAINDPASYGQAGDVAAEQVVETFFTWYKHAIATEGPARAAGLARESWYVLLGLVAAAWYRLTGRRISGLLPVRRRSAVDAYLSADLVASTAGNFIYSRSHLAGLPILGPLFLIAYAWLCGKPLYMMPQTVGPLWRPWERRVVAQTLRPFRLLLLRDPTSQDLLDSMPMGRTPLRLTPDLAFVYEGASADHGRQTLRSFGAEPDRPMLGVTLLDWGAQHPGFGRQAHYERAVAYAVRHFVQTYEGQAMLFAQVCGPTPADDDRNPARRIMAQLAAWDVAHVHMADDELSPATLQAAYACCDLFLGSRLHSNIFALTRHVPVVAIAYQDKTIGVMRMLGLEEWTIRIEDVDGDALVPLLDRLWLQRDQVRERVVRSVMELQAVTDAALEQIPLDYAALKGSRK